VSVRQLVTSARAGDERSTYTLGQEGRKCHDENRGEDGRAEHDAPVQPGDVAARRVGHVVEGEAADCSEHDAKGSPDLPSSPWRKWISISSTRLGSRNLEVNLLHDERATDQRRSGFGGKDGDGGGSEADSDAEEETSSEQVLPAVDARGPDATDERDRRRKGHGVAATHDLVDGTGEPAPEHGAAEVRRPGRQSEKPLVLRGTGSAFRRDQTELRRPEQVGAVRDRLVHALRGGGHTASDDDKVQLRRKERGEVRSSTCAAQSSRNSAIVRNVQSWDDSTCA
jgi:hypothetical protein